MFDLKKVSHVQKWYFLTFINIQFTPNLQMKWLYWLLVKFANIKMEFQGRLRQIVIIVSLIIFCYQVKVALENLIGKETVDSSEYIKISELESPPVITFCPRQGEDFGKIKRMFGYWKSQHLMKGNYKSPKLR